jgi:hypothetical protein
MWVVNEATHVGKENVTRNLGRLLWVPWREAGTVVRVTGRISTKYVVLPSEDVT